MPEENHRWFGFAGVCEKEMVGEIGHENGSEEVKLQAEKLVGGS